MSRKNKSVRQKVNCHKVIGGKSLQGFFRAKEIFLKLYCGGIYKIILVF